MGEASQKSTSAHYTQSYQENQLEKYRARSTNHWQYRIALANRMVQNIVLPRVKKRLRAEVVVVDVGCSIGTFALEFAKSGFRAFGIDFDQIALKMAVQLATEQGVEATFLCGDVSHWPIELPKIDIAVCFDIFEHLHDDEIGSLLVALRRNLSGDGQLIFHTSPTEYQYIFFGHRLMAWPLIPFVWLSKGQFARLTKAYAAILDVIFLIIRGKTHKEWIARDIHCNMLTKERIDEMLQRAGYEKIYLDTAHLFPNRISRPRIKRWFSKHEITHPNLFGVYGGYSK